MKVGARMIRFGIVGLLSVAVLDWVFLNQYRDQLVQFMCLSALTFYVGIFVQDWEDRNENQDK